MRVGCHLTASPVHRRLRGVVVPLDQRTPAVDAVSWALGFSYSDPKVSELTVFATGILPICEYGIALAGGPGVRFVKKSSVVLNGPNTSHR